jgi:excisionase family DNA binding protein
VTAARAVLADLRTQFAQRQQLAANSITRDDAAELLGISAQSVTDKLAAGKLVGIKVGREWRLPAWQFDPDMPDSVLPDLNIVQTVFPGGPVSLSQWILRPQPEFDGRTPREELIRHGSAGVIELAGALTATGW